MVLLNQDQSFSPSVQEILLHHANYHSVVLVYHYSFTPILVLQMQRYEIKPKAQRLSTLFLRVDKRDLVTITTWPYREM